MKRIHSISIVAISSLILFSMTGCKGDQPIVARNIETPERSHPVARAVPEEPPAPVVEKPVRNSVQALRGNVELTSRAWKLLGKKEYEAAIEVTEQGISKFGPAATALQEELQRENAVVRNGAVTPEQRAQVDKNGLLNDVGACYFVKGRALLELQRKDEAARAFSTLGTLTYARIWDGKGGFWAPAETSSKELQKTK